MVRNNEDRTGPRSTAADEVPADIKQMMNPMDFVAPTEFVELPSQGQGYPQGHPLNGQDSIEIRFMTAKEEDILTSQTLLKKGVAIERVLQSLVKDKSIDVGTMLIGDRNAILVAGDDVVNEDGLRYQDEFVRHKLLDAVGDLALAGAPIFGRFVGHYSGHHLNNQVLRNLMRNSRFWTLTTVREATEQWGSMIDDSTYEEMLESI